MAVGTGIASLGLAIGQTVAGGIRAKKDRKAIHDFRRQDLINPLENIQISTLRSDKQTDANLSNFATSVDALQRGGTRAISTGLPRINEGNILVQNQILQDLEDQDQQRNILIAQGEERIRAIREGREINALQGLGQSLQTNRQDTFSGTQNIISSSLALTAALEAAKDE
jgi:hypothetical protein